MFLLETAARLKGGSQDPEEVLLLQSYCAVYPLGDSYFSPQ